MKKQKITFLDGGMGTSLAKLGKDSSALSNLTNPDAVKKIHLEFIQSGADIIQTNTFSANPAIYRKDYKKLISEGVKLARKAVAESGCKVTIAGSIGPTGKMVSPIGTLDFEEAVNIFKKAAGTFYDAGVDTFIIETFDDISEMRAALIGLGEAVPDARVFASMTFSSGDRTSTGTPAEAAAIAMDALGADVIGVNCSFGPEGLAGVVKKMRRYTKKPLMAQPNAGLPDVSKGTMVYPENPVDFASKCRQLVKAGASFIGGCCGTSPDHIASLKKIMKDICPSSPPESVPAAITSRTSFTVFGEFPVIIGERINFTARPELATSEAKVVAEGLKQKKAGALALDVNLGSNEERTLETVMAVERRVSLPVVLDSHNAAEIEKTVRRYPGVLLLNSISAEKEKMKALFPIVKKYGLPFIALCVSDKGVPSAISGKLKIAELLLKRAREEKIPEGKILVDPVVLAASSDTSSAYKTLRAIEKISANTVIGVSNVSGGMPQRALLNQALSTLAVYCGASALIADPMDADLVYIFHASALLSGRDTNALNYTGYFAPGSEKFSFDNLLSQAVFEGSREEASRLSRMADRDTDPIEIIEKQIAPALDRVGKEYSEKRLFLPQLVESARSAEAAVEEIEKYMKAGGSERKKKGTIVIATVKGDIHDIGKNLVTLLLKNSSFNVVDMGVDVDSARIVDEAVKRGAHIIALSALMTTTMESMKEVKRILDSRKLKIPVLVGGAAVTEKFAAGIGAFYAKDAVKAVKAAENIISG